MAYREVLHRWAAQHVPEGATITDVEIAHGEGRVWSEWTIENAYLYVTISYRTPDGLQNSVIADEEDAVKLLVDMGRLLAELFAIEDAS